MAAIKNYYKPGGLKIPQNLFSHGSGDQKSKISITRLKSKCQQDHLPSKDKGRINPCLFQLLMAVDISLLMATSL